MSLTDRVEFRVQVWVVRGMHRRHHVVQRLRVKAPGEKAPQDRAGPVVEGAQSLSLQEVLVLQHLRRLGLRLHVGHLRHDHEHHRRHQEWVQAEEHGFGREAMRPHRVRVHARRPPPEQGVREEPWAGHEAALPYPGAHRAVHDGVGAPEFLQGHGYRARPALTQARDQEDAGRLHERHHHRRAEEGRGVPEQVPCSRQSAIPGQGGVPTHLPVVVQVHVPLRAVGVQVVRDDVLDHPRGVRVEERGGGVDAKLVDPRVPAHGEVGAVMRDIRHHEPSQERQGQGRQVAALEPANPRRGVRHQNDAHQGGMPKLRLVRKRPPVEVLTHDAVELCPERGDAAGVHLIAGSLRRGTDLSGHRVLGENMFVHVAHHVVRLKQVGAIGAAAQPQRQLTTRVRLREGREIVVVAVDAPEARRHQVASCCWLSPLLGALGLGLGLLSRALQPPPQQPLREQEDRHHDHKRPDDHEHHYGPLDEDIVNACRHHLHYHLRQRHCSSCCGARGGPLGSRERHVPLCERHVPLC
mmetsp:Transcript_60083/g.82577  ORF Transcript_60083/g.82577 Transcript_60083/m.82577 type:complete len:524 (-) Transcript_60083:118-1689(-)